MSTLGELLLSGDLSSQRLGETHNPRRLRICGPQMFGEKCEPGVIAENPCNQANRQFGIARRSAAQSGKAHSSSISFRSSFASWLKGLSARATHSCVNFTSFGYAFAAWIRY